MNQSLRALLIDLFKPLSLAAYAAWLTVGLSLSNVFAAGDLRAWAAGVSMLSFLLLFVIENVFGDKLSLRAFAVVGALLSVLALIVCALSAQSASPILLVLAASVLAARLSGTSLWLALGTINVFFAIILFTLWPGQPRWIAVSFAAYVSFQMFATLVMQYAKRAEDMSEQLRSVNADLIATRSLLAESARDAERLRLSRELHDVAGHALTALKLNLGVLARDSQQPDMERVTLCAGLADDLLQNLRGVVRQMRAHEGIDLREAIERLAAPFPKPIIHLDIDADARLNSLDHAEALLRTVQEGLTNAARHAVASDLWLRLQRIEDRVVLSIRDNGKGARVLTLGSGLCGMRERLVALGGDLTVDHGVEGGLQLTATLPVASA